MRIQCTNNICFCCSGGSKAKPLKIHAVHIISKGRFFICICLIIFNHYIRRYALGPSIVLIILFSVNIYRNTLLLRGPTIRTISLGKDCQKIYAVHVRWGQNEGIAHCKLKSSSFAFLIALIGIL